MRWRWGGAVLLIWLFLAIAFIVEGLELVKFTQSFAEVRTTW